MIELVWLGLLLLLPLLWVVLAVFEVQRGSFGVSGAARSAARAFALAPDDVSGQRAAEAAARAALADQGVPEAPLQVRVSCTTGRGVAAGVCRSGTSVITVTVSSHVDLPLAPSVLGEQQPRFALEASHTVPFGQFREIVPAAGAAP